MCTNFRPTSRELAREFLGQGIRFADSENFRAEVYPGHVAPIIRKAHDEGNPQPGLQCTSAVFGLLLIWSEDGKNYWNTYNARVSDQLSLNHLGESIYAGLDLCLIGALLPTILVHVTFICAVI